MIEIKDGRIYFYHSYKTEIKAQDFQCISAYVCPECKNILLAYFVGNIKDLSDYAERDDMKHAYDMGWSNGGQWIALQGYLHQHQLHCKWEYFTGTRGLDSGAQAFAERYKVKNRGVALIDAIEKKGLEGFKLVPDEVGTDAPLLMYNENIIMNGFTFKERLNINMDKHLDKILNINVEVVKT